MVVDEKRALSAATSWNSDCRSCPWEILHKCPGCARSQVTAVDLGTERRESRSASTAVASAPDGAGPDAGHEPVASGGTERRTALEETAATRREQLESFALAPWASRRRRDLLELLDRLTPTIAELTQAIEQEAEKCPAAQCLQTHPGVGETLVANAPTNLVSTNWGEKPLVRLAHSR